MSTEGNSKIWNHEHSFGQDKKRSSETRTIIVILITASIMCIEILASLAYGSMALLADGLHMASHTAALSISAYMRTTLPESELMTVHSVSGQVK